MDARSLSQTEAKVILSLEAEGLEEVSLKEIQHRGSISPGTLENLPTILCGRDGSSGFGGGYTS